MVAGEILDYFGFFEAGPALLRPFFISCCPIYRISTSTGSSPWVPQPPFTRPTRPCSPMAWASSTMPRPSRSTSTWNRARLPEPGCRDVVGQFPGPAPRCPGIAGDVGHQPVAGWWLERRPRPGRCHRAAAGRHLAPGTGRPSRLRDHPRAGARRHGGGLPRPEQAHGASGGAQGRQRAPGRAARACATGSSARSSRPPSCNTRISSPRTRPSGSARASSLPWSTSRGTTWPRWSSPTARCR